MKIALVLACLVAVALARDSRQYNRGGQQYRNEEREEEENGHEERRGGGVGPGPVGPGPIGPGPILPPIIPPPFVGPVFPPFLPFFRPFFGARRFLPFALGLGPFGPLGLGLGPLGLLGKRDTESQRINEVPEDVTSKVAKEIETETSRVVCDLSSIESVLKCQSEIKEHTFECPLNPHRIPADLKLRLSDLRLVRPTGSEDVLNVWERTGEFTQTSSKTTISLFTGTQSNLIGYEVQPKCWENIENLLEKVQEKDIRIRYILN